MDLGIVEQRSIKFANLTIQDDGILEFYSDYDNINDYWKLKVRFSLPDLLFRKPGPGCSKLTMSLVHVWFIFQTLRLKYANIFSYFNVRSFCNSKASLIFSTKNISIFGYKVIKYLMSCPLNELVKLTML